MDSAKCTNKMLRSALIVAALVCAFGCDAVLGIGDTEAAVERMDSGAGGMGGGKPMPMAGAAEPSFELLAGRRALPLDPGAPNEQPSFDAGDAQTPTDAGDAGHEPEDSGNNPPFTGDRDGGDEDG